MSCYEDCEVSLNEKNGFILFTSSLLVMLVWFAFIMTFLLRSMQEENYNGKSEKSGELEKETAVMVSSLYIAKSNKCTLTP